MATDDYESDSFTYTDDGGVEFDIAEPEQQLRIDEDSPNIVFDLQDTPEGKLALRKIAMCCNDAFQAAWSSSEEYRARIAKDWKLFAGDMPRKTFPFENCANGNIPVLIENHLRILSRMEAEIFGDWTSVVGVVPVGPEDEAIAEAISKHDNWQIREAIPGFTRESLRMLSAFIHIGDVNTESFYDTERRTNRHECLTTDEFVTPYTHVSVMDDYADVPYVCRVLHRYRNELQAKRGTWANIDAIIKKQAADFDSDPEAELRETMADVHGESTPDDAVGAYSAPYKLIKFHGYIGAEYLPGETDDRFMECIFCPETLHIAKLTVHEEISWQDRAKQRMQQAELDAYTNQRAQAEQLRQQQQQKRYDIQRQLQETNATAEEQTMAMAGTDIVIPDPPPPAWLDDPDNPPMYATMPSKSPIRNFAHGVNIEPMAGVRGLGYGRIQADFTRAINTAFNQFIDAATVANAPHLFSSYDMPKDMSAMPGKITKIDALGEDLASGFYQPPVSGANPQLIEAVGMLIEQSQKSAQAPDVLSGNPGKSGETFRGIASRIEQATKQLSSMGRKFSNGVFKQVLMNNARLNSIYLEEEQLVSVLDHLTKQYETLTIRRDMYERDYKVEIRADLRFTSEAQKQQEAMEMVQLPQTVPALQGNLAFTYRVLVDYLKARKLPQLINDLGPQPQPPQQFGESLIQQAQAEMQQQMAAAGGQPPEGGGGPPV